MKLLLIMITSQLIAQVHVTFSPTSAYNLKNETVWNVTACVASSTSPGVNVRGGDVLSMLTLKGIQWLTQSQAVTSLQAAPQKSWVAELAKWGGYGTAAAAFLLTTNVVKASTAWTAGITTGSGALNVIVPLATKAVPPVPTDVQSNLLGPFLVVPMGNCSSAIVIGSSGSGFEGTIP